MSDIYLNLRDLVGEKKCGSFEKPYDVTANPAKWTFIENVNDSCKYTKKTSVSVMGQPHRCTLLLRWRLDSTGFF